MDKNEKILLAVGVAVVVVTVRDIVKMKKLKKAEKRRKAALELVSENFNAMLDAIDPTKDPVEKEFSSEFWNIVMNNR